MSDAHPTQPPIRGVPLGDHALLLVFGDRVDRAIHARVLGFTATLHRAGLRGVTDVVPAFSTIGLWFDPTSTTFERLLDEVGRLGPAPVSIADRADDPVNEWVIPTRYDGPDLAEVAERTALSPSEVVARHVGRVYTVFMIGFVPGFGFLGELDPALLLPRRSSPRRRVPAGSVAIAGAQTAVYPLDTPGGWHLIGRTDLTLFDPGREPPALLRAGDRVRFEPIP
jgi:inhibitor of KinA